MQCQQLQSGWNQRHERPNTLPESPSKGRPIIADSRLFFKVLEPGGPLVGIFRRIDVRCHSIRSRGYGSLQLVVPSAGAQLARTCKPGDQSTSQLCVPGCCEARFQRFLGYLAPKEQLVYGAAERDGIKGLRRCSYQRGARYVDAGADRFLSHQWLSRC